MPIKKGSEDEDVRALQASLSIPEDGIMTAELLEQGSIDGNSTSPVHKESENGASFASVTEVSTIKQIVVKENKSEFEASHHRMLLLGENRWKIHPD